MMKPERVMQLAETYGLGWLAGIAVIASFVLMFLHFRDPLPGPG